MVSKTSNASMSWYSELQATLKLALPLIISQLASIFLFTTDVVMMGWLGPQFLAGGSLAMALLHPLFIGCVGLVSATAPLIAQAIGARDIRSVRRTVRQGFWASIILAFIVTPILFNAEFLFLLLGQNPDVAKLSQGYLYTASAVIIPGLGFIALRSLLQARDAANVVLWISIAGIFVNGLGNYALMFGNFGFPRMELAGAGISTSVVNLFMFLTALVYVVLHKKFKRYYILVRLWKPDWPRLIAIFKIGTPIGLSVMSEVGMFGAAVVMMGWIGTDAVAAHAIVQQCAAIAFMIPLGLSQAVTVRVGLAVGRGNAESVRKAGWTGFGLNSIAMSITSAAFLLAPLFFVTLFLPPENPANQIPIQLAVSYLMIAALFQFVDGAQVVMAFALRGLNDTTVPMLVAIFGYWVIGMSVAYIAGFQFGMGGQGIWIGLAAGLAFNAVILTIRFAQRDRLGLMEKALKM